MPVRLLRSARPRVPGGPRLVTAGDVVEFKERVGDPDLPEINENHDAIAAAAETAEAAVQFFRGANDRGG